MIGDVKTTPADLPKADRLESLQAMRSIAAILVVLFHLTATARNQFGYRLWGGAFENGEAGVDIFFVLSGFIIYYSTSRKPDRSRVRFLLARFIRIYPIYWLVLVGLVLIEWAGLSNDPERLDGWAILGSALLAPGADYVLIVAWTLSIEVIFYLFFCITYFEGRRFYFLALGVWAMLSVMATHINEPGDLPEWIAGFLLYSGNSEFLFGGIVAYLHASRISRFQTAALYVGIVWFVSSLAGLGIGAEIGMSREFDFGIPAALIIYGVISKRMRLPRLLIRLGDSSYILYLTHGLVLAVGSRLCMNWVGADWISSPIMPAILASASIVMAAIGHHTVEKPLLGSLNQRILAKPTTPQISSTDRSTSLQ